MGIERIPVNPPGLSVEGPSRTRVTVRLTAFFEPSQAGGARWLSMEGLRGFAVLLVFLVHYTAVLQLHLAPDPGLRSVVDTLATGGLCGVDLFFVLSGLLIYRACIQPQFKARTYAKRRVARIYPTFLAVFALYLFAMLAFPATSRLPGKTGPDVLYVLSNLLFLPGLFPILPMITVAWSISYEALFYILMPLAAYALRLRRRSSQWRIGLALALAACMIAVQAKGHLASFEMVMFLGGVIVSECGDSLGASLSPAARPWLLDMLALTLAGLALIAFGSADGRTWLTANLGDAQQVAVRYTGVGVAFSFLVYRCLFARSVAGALFSWRPLRWLGNMSYSFYLFHSIPLQAARLAWKALAPDWRVGLLGYLFLVPPFLLASIVLTLPLYIFVERELSLNRAERRTEPLASGSRLDPLPG